MVPPIFPPRADHADDAAEEYYGLRLSVAHTEMVPTPISELSRSASYLTTRPLHVCGISVVSYSNRCSFLLTAFSCIYEHFDAFNKISLHSMLLHS